MKISTISIFFLQIWLLAGSTAAYQPWKKPVTKLAPPPTTSNSNATPVAVQQRQQLSRRQFGELSFAAAGLGLTLVGTRETQPTDYGLWGILPVGTYKSKKTVQQTIVPDTVWTLEQKFGILNVQVPLRMTIIRLKQPKECLLIYNPIAPTKECLDMIQEISNKYNCPVKHILVGSVALEHKAYAGPMAQRFKEAAVYLQPGQYSFPSNLPDSWLGFPGRRTFTMPASIDQAPADWRQELDFATLGPIISRDGAFGETVVLHKPTKTLLVTDTALQATDEVPACYEYDHAPLLYHARDKITDQVQDTEETRKKGWRRIVIFGLFFTPSAITIQDAATAWQERRPDINSDFLGVYPWEWNIQNEEASWKALTGDGTRGPLVAPILQVLLLNRSPVEVLDFADKVGSWDFNRIIPAHLKNDLKFNGEQYRKSFGFLEERGVPEGYPKPLDRDLQSLRDAEVSLIESGAIAPAPPKVGGTLSRAEIIAQTTYKCRKGVCAPRADP